MGAEKEENLSKPLDDSAGGQSSGVPASGELDGNSFNPLGNPGMQHWQASFIDEAGLNERGNIFFAAVEMTRMPMVVTDPNQHDNPIVFTNRAFLDLTGYREDQLIGRNCRMLQGPDTDRRAIDEVRKAVEEQRAVAVDVLNYKADGRPFWNALFIGPIFDQNGKLLYFFASQMDITERHVSQASMMQAQKMEAIGQLTAGMAHDFNNLLQVISGNLELTMKSISGEHAAIAPILRAQQACTRAAKLTEQLLTFARKQRLEPRRINLNTLVVEFSELLVKTLGDRVELRLDLHPGLPPCRLDPTHLEMALLNVLINARDAMDDGGEVTVSTAELAKTEDVEAHALPPGQYVQVCVSDTGHGMPPEVLRRATEPFFTTKGPGTGLGLAMVHGFVQQSSGKLEIDSTPGQGTQVRLIFPVASPDADAGQPEPPEQSASDGEQHCILVVEDNEDVRDLAVKVLGLSGFRVLGAASGESALAMLEQHPDVDLLFTDVIMPGGMNGLQLAERVRKQRPGLPVLLTTGYMDELPAKDRPGERLDVLAKPYKHSDLLGRIRQALGQRA
ncbi:histidine kinase famiy protein [Massilia terrae]|uniref:histidine kinase n=1 Tax=Massilia terrae TaxID=1811224 RepID=A0ABT2CWQ2_9BURK|nr:histidine kinase famiy protein [Massilia terrae]MCS0658413.1 histidine kinase famiy protein [Massilia terrae]